MGQIIKTSQGAKKGELYTHIQVEGQQVAVFKYGSSFLATAAKCPHVGGPLHLGDIEVKKIKHLIDSDL